MDVVIVREACTPKGQFGSMTDTSGKHLFVTLEHSYLLDSGLYAPKVAPGTYSCHRHPPNRLPYETFELEGVPDFMGKPVSGILIHVGNYNRDSEGCIEVGLSRISAMSMIVDSRRAFESFMGMQHGVDRFKLTVRA